VRLLVTGGSGFVGRVFLKELGKCELGNVIDKVFLIIHKSSLPLSLMETLRTRTDVQLISHDLTRPWDFDLEVDVLLNMAADGSESAYSDHATKNFLQINENLLTWARKSSLRRVIHISSGICDYLELAPDSPILKSANKYAFAKGRLTVEQKLKAMKLAGDVTTHIFRLYSFVGREFMKNQQYAINQFIQGGTKNGLIDVRGNSQTRRSYLHEVDLGSVLLEALFASDLPNISSIASHEIVTMGQLAELVGDMLGATVRLSGENQPIEDYIPQYAKELIPKPGNPTRSLGDSIRSILGFE
jgi:nucleoside-diphosphate-sugar epimerase